jgi:hypothetical protein
MDGAPVERPAEQKGSRRLHGKCVTDSKTWLEIHILSRIFSAPLPPNRILPEQHPPRASGIDFQAGQAGLPGIKRDSCCSSPVNCSCIETKKLRTKLKKTCHRVTHAHCLYSSAAACDLPEYGPRWRRSLHGSAKTPETKTKNTKERW